MKSFETALVYLLTGLVWIVLLPVRLENQIRATFVRAFLKALEHNDIGNREPKTQDADNGVVHSRMDTRHCA